MIGSLRGVLTARRPKGDHGGELLIEAGPVGYRVVTPASTAAAIGTVGSTVHVHVHTHVREDALILYGFASVDERNCFEVLIGAHGVGPAVALALLSVHSPLALRHAVAIDDLDALMLVPGIGKKTAARLVIELKTRLEVDDDSMLAPRASDNGHPSDEGSARRREVRAALEALGYGPEEIRVAAQRLPPEGTVEDLIRAALRELAGSR
ncbi:MAG: Holliday junction branch migration protein RuvA [Actinomycetota bacterium]|nr:Holliday junction branch migration protein RuvA [Actinomycetota bacterium]